MLAGPGVHLNLWQCSSKGRYGNKAIKTKLLLLGLIAGLFRWVWIGAAITSVYLLHAVLSTDAPAHYLLWSIGAGVIARNIAAIFRSSKAQVDYVDQLMTRGFTHAAATSAWEIASNGGSNLLLRLQQTENIEAVDSPSAEQCNPSAEISGQNA